MRIQQVELVVTSARRPAGPSTLIVRYDPHPGVSTTGYVYINKEMSREHITTTVKQVRECIPQRHEKKIPEEDDFESPSPDGRVNVPQAAEGGTTSVWCANHRSSQLVKSVIPRLGKRAGRALDWHICVAI